MLVVSDIDQDGMCLPMWDMLCYVYGLSDEMICIEMSFAGSS